MEVDDQRAHRAGRGVVEPHGQIARRAGNQNIAHLAYSLRPALQVAKAERNDTRLCRAHLLEGRQALLGERVEKRLDLGVERHWRCSL